VLAAGGPWYGLPDFVETRRMISGSGGGTSGKHLRLSHDWGSHDVVLEVETHTHLRGSESIEYSARANLLFRARELRDPKPSDYPLHLTIEREEFLVQVDDRRVPFVVLRMGNDWVANGDVDDRAVEVHSIGYPLETLALVSVDPSDYWSPTA
jgi:hypothetical protein